MTVGFVPPALLIRCQNRGVRVFKVESMVRPRKYRRETPSEGNARLRVSAPSLALRK